MLLCFRPSDKASYAQRMWKLKHMRAHRFDDASLETVFQAWRCWSSFHGMHTVCKRRCRELRKQRLRDQLNEAQAAAEPRMRVRFTKSSN